MTSHLGETWRGLRRRPAPAIAAILALAFAIGLFSAMVSVLQAFLFRPLIVHDVDQVVRVRERISATVGTNVVSPSPAMFDALRRSQNVFEDMAAATAQGVALQGNLETESLRAALVTANFFHVLGISPKSGRDFQPGEDMSGRDSVALLSDAAWRNRFNADPSIIGRVLQIDGEARTVIGIMPENFSHPYEAELWLPFRWDTVLRQNSGNFLYVPARLRPGLSIAMAQAGLDATASAIHAQQPELGQSDATSLTSMRDETLGDLGSTLWVLFASAFFVLLVATFNTAAVFYAQGVADARATMVRVALGASAAALFRRALVRSGCVVGIATVIGMLTATQFYSPLLALTGDSSLNEFDAVVRLDLPTAAWICVASAVMALALAMLDVHYARTLTSSAGFGTRGASIGRGTRRRLSMATVVQCAMSFVLAAVGLFVTLGYAHLIDMDRGYRSEKVLLADLAFPTTRYPTPASRNALLDRLLGELRAMPDVDFASGATVTPDYQGSWAASFVVPGRAPLPEPGNEPTNHRLVAPRYFGTLGMRLLAGRDFDGVNPLVDANSVIVSRSFAEHAWPGEEAVGKVVTRRDRQNQTISTLTIIGVVADVVEATRDSYAPPSRSWYLSTAAGSNYDFSSITLAVRARNNPAELATSLRRTLLRLDPELAASHVLPMDVRLAESLGREKLSSFLYTLFAGCALLISLCSLYGTLSFVVETNRQEFAVRLAIGAQPRQVLLDILSRSLRLVTIGIALGMLFSIPAARTVGSLMQGTTLRDWWAMLPLVAIMISLALVASFLPARRASSIDPMVALRHE
ncbi:MAG: ABC transporter permease [Dokdonella sp.]